MLSYGYLKNKANVKMCVFCNLVPTYVIDTFSNKERNATWEAETQRSDDRLELLRIMHCSIMNEKIVAIDN